MKTRKSPIPLLGALLLVFPGSAASVKADPAALIAAQPRDLSKQPTLYMIGYSHLDTEWRWSYPQVIREFLPATLHQNFDLFDKYPDYVFNWTGSNRYKLMKEYYPADYAKLKQYVAAGRWYPCGSNVEECDVDVPSEESLVRQVLYGNRFFRSEFGSASDEFMIPDSFGYPESLPSILAHCGLAGFSTQKLTIGSAVGIPFNVGVWQGTDGQSVIAALNPGKYHTTIDGDLSHDAGDIQRVNDDGHASGLFADYLYYGVGDTGGAPTEDSVRNLEKSLSAGGPLTIVSARASDMFDQITPQQRAALPHYQGDLLLTNHSAGSITSQASMKLWNRKNELLADAAERASVAADWLGAAPYEKDRLDDAWQRFLPGQFHDLMAGTAMPQSYAYAWNDQLLAMNEFAGVLQQAAGGVIRGLDTRGRGISVAVYNPLSIDRQDVATAKIAFPGDAPAAVRVIGPDGKETPSQIVDRDGKTATILFLAKAPSVGFASYNVQPADAPAHSSSLSVSQNGLENERYRIRLNDAGDIASIYDKTAKRELLSAPARLAFQHENPSRYPAWNMDWQDQSQPPSAYVDGTPAVKIVENGPVRVALQVERDAQDSHFIQTIRLSAGNAGDRVEIANGIDWKTKEVALKAVLPLTVSNPSATYNWEVGTVQRGNDNPKLFESPAHDWFDLTDKKGDYGVSVLTVAKYGSDKPDDGTLRLTLLYTPGTRGGYQDQGTQDLGHHEFVYGVEGHTGDWRDGQTQWEAARLNQPLIAFQTPAHPGPLGRAFSLARTSTPQVSIEALKQAEDGHEIVVRVNELAGKTASNVHLNFASPIVSAREVDGQERPVGAARVEKGQLVFDTTAYHPRAFAVTLAPATTPLAAPVSQSIPLHTDGDEPKAVNEANKDFDGHGNSLPDELLPDRLDDGVTFSVKSREYLNAVSCQGQTLNLPAGKGRRVYLLAAASGGDEPADFRVGDKPVSLTIQSGDGYIGQWDTRQWEGQIPESTYDWHNAYAGLTPGYIKTAQVAWYADHKRLASGESDPYAFCYLYKYAIAIPDDARTLTLPGDPRIRLFAASVSQNPNDDATLASPVIDPIKS